VAGVERVFEDLLLLARVRARGAALFNTSATDGRDGNRPRREISSDEEDSDEEDSDEEDSDNNDDDEDDEDDDSSSGVTVSLLLVTGVFLAPALGAFVCAVGSLDLDLPGFGGGRLGVESFVSMPQNEHQVESLTAWDLHINGFSAGMFILSCSNRLRMHCL
jgi:hypothetical protein